MCGMGGFISKSTLPLDIKVLRNILMLNILRGEDSTGMFDYVPSQKPNVMLWKTNQHPITFLNDKFYNAWENRWEKNKPLFAAVHCRAATQGKITKANSHPFKHGNIIGMHNGTIEKKFKNRHRFDTDSEALFYNISTMGLANALGEIQNCDPAYALVWYDLKDKTLNFIRNSKRPLSYVTQFKDTIYWSSDATHLSLAVSSAAYSKSSQTTTPFAIGVHYKIQTQAKELDFEKTAVKEAEEPVHYLPNWGRNYSSKGLSLDYWENLGKSNKEKEVSVDKHSYSVYDSKTGKWFTPYQKSNLDDARISEKPLINATSKVNNTEPVDKTPPFTPDAKEVKEKTLFPFGPGLQNFCSESEWRRKTHTGCVCCGQRVIPGETTLWVDNEEFLCQDCAEAILWDEDFWVNQYDYFSEAQKDTLKRDYLKLFPLIDSNTSRKEA